MNRFGDLLRHHRKQCNDREKDGPLTQERLGELIGRELGDGGGYTGAAVSDWERGKSQIDKDHRLVLVSLIKVLYALGGLHTRAEANELLLAGNYRPLDDKEAHLVFPGTTPPQEAQDYPPASSHWRAVLLLLIESIFQPDPAAASGGYPPHWTSTLLSLFGNVSDRWTSERVLRAVFWIGVWLLTWGLTFPLLYWPFAGREQAWQATLMYIGGALVLPTFAGVLRVTREDKFWQQVGLANARILRFYTHLGATIGFHLGYVLVFTVALIGYYLGLGRLASWLSGLAAAWPVILAYAGARQAPVNQWRAFGALRLADGAVFSVFVLFGPLWGLFFYAYYPLLLSPAIGITLILVDLGVLAALSAWQRRRGNAVIPAYVWAALWGSVLVLYQASAGGTLFTTTVSATIVITVAVLMAQERIHITLGGGFLALVVLGLLLACTNYHLWFGRAITLVVVFAWWLKGKKYIWFPASFWGITAVILGCILLIRQDILTQVQASGLVLLCLPAILWIESRATSASAQFPGRPGA